MINKQTMTETVFTFHTGPASYKTRIIIGGRVGDDSRAADGTLRPGAHFRMDGLADDADHMETTVFRAFNEDELRELARLCLMAAGQLRRIENKRRAQRKEKEEL